MNDLELLQKYVRDGSESAFAELARRYVSLVYSAALRHVRNAQDAEDVTQAVFVLLARKARGLSAASGGIVVPAWLLRATHFASKTLLRGRARRQRHEARAATMMSERSGGSGTGASGKANEAPDWEQVAPLLDQAIASLGEAARDALVLRFFRGKSYREVAERLAIGEPAARQRVSRAVEQLRTYFARRGVSLSAASLEGLVAAHGVQPAPAALASLAAAAGVKGAVAAAQHAALAQGAAVAMIPASAKVAAMAAAFVIVGAASLAFYEVAHDRSRTLAVGTPNVAPVPTPIVQAQAGPIRGRVLDPSGRPAAGAEVLLARVSSAVSVYGPAAPGVLAVTAGPDGSFEFPATGDATALVARTDEGFAQVRIVELQSTPTIRLVPWGHIEGTLKVGDTPRVGETVKLSRTGGSLPEWYAWRIMHETAARTDGRGHFTFARVIPLPPGSNQQIELKWPAPNNAGVRFADVSVAPRQTLHVELGGTGRPVTGHLAAPPGLPAFEGELVAQPPPPGATTRPADSIVVTPTVIPVVVSSDGSFRADDIPAGTYNLVFVSVDKTSGGPISEAIAQANTTVTVLPMAGGRSDEPLDVGTLKAFVNPALVTGQQAPDFVATTGDGKPIRLSDLRGKHVLLYVQYPGTPDEGWVRTADLQVILDRFGDRPDFALLDVTLRPNTETAPPSAQTGSRSWIRATAEPPPGYIVTTQPTTQPTKNASDSLPEVYLSSATRLFLIGPDGKCVARSLDGHSAFSRVGAALSRSTWSTAGVRVTVAHHGITNVAAVRLTGTSAGESSEGKRDDNVARSARFALVDGQPGDMSGGLGVLNDGRLANNEDQPAANFFFNFGVLEGRFRMDLDEPVPIRQVNTYSRHRTHRGPQVYRLYGSDGLSAEFDPKPRVGVDPATCGWTRIADVDTRPTTPGAPDGGQYAVSLTGADGPIGRFRHLLFVAFATETDDNWGQTFFSEVEVFRQEGRP